MTDTQRDRADDQRAGAPRATAQRWADLTRRSFGFDVLACPHCGGRMRLIALIEQATVIERILRHLDLPIEVPEPRPARAPPILLDASPRRWDQDLTFDPCS